MDNFDIQTQRNLKSINLEKEGKILEAIELYEKNIREGFIGSHPYNRLAIIYHRQKQYDKELMVLERTLKIFENDHYRSMSDKLTKFEKFQQRLLKLKNKIA